jgi:hypothetical protein
MFGSAASTKSVSQHPGVVCTVFRHAGLGTGQRDSELRTVTDEPMPPLVTALMVVFAVLTAMAPAVPVPSVIAVEGVIVPAPMAKATVTFGTTSPLELSTRADTFSCWGKTELAVRTRRAGVVDGVGAGGSGGGWTPS